MRFPTILEILRDIYSYMGIKAERKDDFAKRLDDKAKDIHAPYYDESYALDNLAPKGFSVSTKNLFITLVQNNLINEYRDFLKTARFTAVMEPDHVRHIIWSNSILPNLTKIIGLCLNAQGVSIGYVTKNYLQEAITYLESNSKTFNTSIKQLSQEDHTYVMYRWGQEDAIPEPHTIRRMFLISQSESSPEHKDQVQDCEILIFSRLLQSLSKDYGFWNLSKNLHKCLADYHDQKMRGKSISQHYIEAISFRTAFISNTMTHYAFFLDLPQTYSTLNPSYFEKNLKRITSIQAKLENVILIPPEKNIKDIVLDMIGQIGDYVETHSELHHYTYFTSWSKANFEVYQYNFSKALKLYEKALDQALYTDMRYIEKLISETILVACLCKSTENTLRKAANIAIKLDLKIPLLTDLDDLPVRIKRLDTFENWEKEAVLVSFYRYFTKATFIDSGKEIDLKLPKTGSLISKKIPEPNYEQPDQKIYIDEGNRREWPQIVYWTKFGSPKQIHKLIAQGANVNAVASTGESALLMAIERYVKDWTGDGKLIFDLIIDQPIDKISINGTTSKRKNSPLRCAIEHGRPDIVYKLLDLGANPNQTGLYGQTPLFYAVHIINAISNKYTIFDEMKKALPMNPYSKDILYRYSNGQFSSFEETPIYEAIANSDMSKLNEISRKHISSPAYKQSVEDMYQIIEILLNFGADPNSQLCETPIKGYSPFMLAVECDLKIVTSIMLQHKASLTQSYTHPNTGRQINVMEIAKNFKSHKFLSICF